MRQFSRVQKCLHCCIVLQIQGLQLKPQDPSASSGSDSTESGTWINFGRRAVSSVVNSVSAASEPDGATVELSLRETRQVSFPEFDLESDRASVLEHVASLDDDSLWQLEQHLRREQARGREATDVLREIWRRPANFQDLEEHHAAEVVQSDTPPSNEDIELELEHNNFRDTPHEGHDEYGTDGEETNSPADDDLADVDSPRQVQVYLDSPPPNNSPRRHRRIPLIIHGFAQFAAGAIPIGQFSSDEAVEIDSERAAFQSPRRPETFDIQSPRWNDAPWQGQGLHISQIPLSPGRILNEDCPVCLEKLYPQGENAGGSDITGNRNVEILGCQHAICVNCLIGWIGTFEDKARGPNCPLCSRIVVLGPNSHTLATVEMTRQMRRIHREVREQRRARALDTLSPRSRQAIERRHARRQLRRERRAAETAAMQELHQVRLMKRSVCIAVVILFGCLFAAILYSCSRAGTCMLWGLA
jgi:hypothetical protein